MTTTPTPAEIIAAAARIAPSVTTNPAAGATLAEWLTSAAERWDEIRPRWEGQHALAIALALTASSALEG
jgi:hypothetical protein